MELKSSYTLEVIKNRNKYVLCVIKVAQRGMHYYFGQEKPHFTHRWLRAEHWMAFDSRLHKLITENTLTQLSGPLRFPLIDSVFLKITKTTIPIDLLCRTIDLEITPADVITAIECKFEYIEEKTEQEYATPQKDLQKKKKETPQKDEPLRKEKSRKGNETPPKERPHCNENLRKRKLRSENETPRKDQLHHGNENDRKEACRIEKKISRCEKLEHGEESHHKEKRNKNNTTPRKESLHEKKSYKENTTPSKNKVYDMLFNEKLPEENQQQKPKRVGIDKTTVLSSTENENDFRNSSTKSQHGNPVLKSNCKSIVQHENESETSSDSEADYNLPKKEKSVEIIESSGESLNDSQEGRNVDKAHAFLNGNTGQKSAKKVMLKRKACLTTIKTVNQRKKIRPLIPPTPKEASASSRMILKSRIALRTPDSTENRKMKEWLGKASPLVNRERTKKTNIESLLNPCIELVSSGEVKSSSSEISSHEEREKRMKTVKERTHLGTYEVTKLFMELTPKSSDKIETLNLMNLSVHDILKTFEQYQPELENLFLEFKSKANHKRNNGVDHFLVMGLLSHNTELKMMETLSDHYEKNRENLPKYGELFSMVLMPEWILRIFMKHYCMTREKAIEQIKAQNDYKMYIQPGVHMDDTMLP